MLNEASSEVLPDAIRSELRRLLDAAFAGAFTDDDWEHALGGVHVWIAEGDRVISHASIIERTLVCDGHRLRVGYVEAVATLQSHRHQRYGSAVMTRAGEIIRARHALGALSTGSHAFYERLGWERWLGPTFVDTPRGRERTAADDGGVMILRTERSPAVDLGGEIVCDWRAGDVW